MTWLSVPRWWLLAVLLTAMTATGLVGVWLVCATVHDWWQRRAFPSLVLSVYPFPWTWRFVTIDREGPWGDEWGSLSIDVLMFGVRWRA